MLFAICVAGNQAAQKLLTVADLPFPFAQSIVSTIEFILYTDGQTPRKKPNWHSIEIKLF